ncbi:unnamed protein product [marine sediment metagenome]|uniref:Uncharacterized protein n=1 Tax=marine sediment metagenome TaxID=412755 RepID=X1MW37_9ZZZZ
MTITNSAFMGLSTSKVGEGYTSDNSPELQGIGAGIDSHYFKGMASVSARGIG